MGPFYFPLAAATALALAATATAATPQETEFFEKDIRPIFVEKCSVCHGDVGSVAGQVTQVRVLEMGDCVGCHKQNSAPTQCATCHT